VIVSIHDAALVLIVTGVIGGWWMWFLRRDGHVTRTVDEVIRGGRFTGKSEQDRPRMIRDIRLAYALSIGMCVLMALIGIAILLRGLVGGGQPPTTRRG
jgi:hypothetical protein